MKLLEWFAEDAARFLCTGCLGQPGATAIDHHMLDPPAPAHAPLCTPDCTVAALIISNWPCLFEIQSPTLQHQIGLVLNIKRDILIPSKPWLPQRELGPCLPLLS